MVDIERSRPRLLRKLPQALANVFRFRNAKANGRAGLSELLQGFGNHGATLLQGLGFRGGSVPKHEVGPGRIKVAGHRQVHRSQPHKSNFRHSSLWHWPCGIGRLGHGFHRRLADARPARNKL